MTSLSFQILSDQEVIDMKRKLSVNQEEAQMQQELSLQFLCTSRKSEYLSHRRHGTHWTRTQDNAFRVPTTRRSSCRIKLGISPSCKGQHPRSEAQQKTSPVAQQFSASAAAKPPGPHVGYESLRTVCEFHRIRHKRYVIYLAEQQASGCCGGAGHAADVSEATDPFFLEYGCLSPSWGARSAETLFRQLPDEIGAWALYEVYVADASWYTAPILPDELQELLSRIYDPSSNIYDISPHALAVVFLAFALASLADLSLPAYNSQADAYFDLGCKSLTQKSISGSTDLYTIQALVLAGLYYATGGPRYSTDVLSKISSLAIGLCQTLGLHRETEHIHLDNITAQRRRALFWEVHSLDTYQSLVFGRPLTIPVVDITCKFPTHTRQTLDRESRLAGFFQTKWTFTREVTAPMAEVYTRTRPPPTYEEISDFDGRLRQFLECAPIPWCAESSFFGYVRTQFIPRLAGTLMVYIHRASFVQALTDWPFNPLDSPHAASFLAAHRGASMVIKSDVQSFALHAERFYRWWPIWSSLISASFILGSIITKSPGSELTPIAFAELRVAVELVDHGAMHSSLAESSLPLLLRLQNKATEVYQAFYPFHNQLDPSSSLNACELGNTENDARLFEESDPRSSSPFAVAVPSLIPGVMPSPSTPEPQAAAPHPTWSTGIPFETFASACSMEAYLAGQMQMQMESPCASGLENWLGMPIHMSETN
ncbi:fungal-specific transcription factor domain-containing protein [Mycena galopus ATCC 62051]|nr:fungal-specific transcription factor domain-containing protein [Mycena galopus ATCC 62051]